MSSIRPPIARRLLSLAFSALLVMALGACAGLSGRDPVRINLVGLEPIQGEGLELRFAVKLRVQNPNDTSIDYDGIALDLDINGAPFASGVSDQKGSVPRFGETVVGIPVSISAFSALRQAFNLAGEAKLDNLPYALRGKLASGLFGTLRFSDAGKLSLPASLQPAMPDGTSESGRR